MRGAVLIALALVFLTGLLLAVDHYAFNPTPVELDERQGAYDAPARVLSRIQADLERVALGQPRSPLPSGVSRHPLERLVEAEDAFLRGRMRAFSDHAAFIRGEAVGRLARHEERLRDDPAPRGQDRMVGPSAYGASLAPGGAAPLVELVRLMRLVDAVLILEEDATLLSSMRYDLVVRRNLDRHTRPGRLLDGIWLRLPCPLIKGRRADFQAARTALGEMAGPLLSCPAPDAKLADFALMERLASHPAGFADLVEPTAPPLRDPWSQAPPPPPWDGPAALRFMDINPDAAEPALRLAVLGGAWAKLDLALFLHAFRDPSAERDAEIRTLMAGVDSLSLSRLKESEGGQSVAYDGSDVSLVPSLRLAAMARIADIPSGDDLDAYSIPCAVFLRHPGLTPALGPGGTLSGCLAGRGRVPGFPETELAAYLNATALADGGVWSGHSGTARYPVKIRDMVRLDQAINDPRAVLAWPEPPMAAPYQTWAHGSLGNHRVAAQITTAYHKARDALERWYETRGLDIGDAGVAASRALFHLANGAGCGGAPPPDSLRLGILDNYDLERLAPLASIPSERLEPFITCSAFAPFDPLLHLAAGRPGILPFLWQAAKRAGEGDAEGLRRLADANQRNHFGKTALMAAAQADQPDSIAFLLEQGARVNADTWMSGRGRTMAHDSRTALMYACAHGTRETILELLEAGADRFSTDSKGLRAVHYLLGLGPTPANPRLGPEDRRMLAAKLYGFGG